MKKTLTIVLSVLVIILVAGLTWWFVNADNLTSSKQPNTNTESTKVQIQSRFDSKIVYTLDASVDTQPLKDHCAAEGGTFNECGTPCAPDAEVCASVCAYTCELTADEISMNVYSNQKYGFSIEYPDSGWDVVVDEDSQTVPKINLYKPDPVGNTDIPLNHFSNSTHVSVFPQGIPTEGLYGQNEEFRRAMNIDYTSDSKVFVLEDGTPFAYFIRPKNAPLANWNESGFIFARLELDNQETYCLRNGERVDQTKTQCDPLTGGDQVVWNGSVKQADLNIIDTMLSTFDFLDEAETLDDLIRLDQPISGQTITSPLLITGEARGNWYFEATFPIMLTNWDGLIIAEGYASAQDDWMTENFVPFAAELEFRDVDTGVSNRGYLILQKNNPSGLPEHDAALEIPVFFEQ